jgi:hypothetical protein
MGRWNAGLGTHIYPLVEYAIELNGHQGSLCRRGFGAIEDDGETGSKQASR